MQEEDENRTERYHRQLSGESGFKAASNRGRDREICIPFGLFPARKRACSQRGMMSLPVQSHVPSRRYGPEGGMVTEGGRVIPPGTDI